LSRARRAGFTLIELVVTAALLALLLILAGQLFVELLRHQEEGGATLVDTTLLVPVDSVLARDAREGLPIENVGDLSSGPSTLLLLLPPTEKDVELVAAWKLSPFGGATRTLYRNGEAGATHPYLTRILLTYEVRDLLGRRQLVVRGTDPSTGAAFARVFTGRNG